jgi:hypothetical protein
MWVGCGALPPKEDEMTRGNGLKLTDVIEKLCGILDAEGDLDFGLRNECNEFAPLLDKELDVVTIVEPPFEGQRKVIVDVFAN